MNEKHHEMILEKNSDLRSRRVVLSYLWRRFLVQWPPAYRMIVLAVGDNDIRHNVSKSNSRIGSCAVAQPGATDLTDEFRLLPWIKWMEKSIFTASGVKTLR